MTPSLPPASPVRRGPGSFFVGATYPLRALKLLNEQPSLRGYVIMPILLNLVIGVTLYAGLLYAGLQAIDWFLASVSGWVTHAPDLDWSAWVTVLPEWDLPSWTFPLPKLALPAWQIAWPDWLPHLPQVSLPQVSLPQIAWPEVTLPNWIAELSEFGLAVVIWILRLVLVISLLLITGLILLQFGVLLGAPWYGQLSEKLEKMQTGQLQIVAINPVREIWRAILYELKKLVLLIGIGLPLLLGQLFPGVGTLISTVGGITLTATIVCLDFCDATLERRRFSFRRKLGLLYRSLPATAGFALVCLGLVSIPFLNLLAIPLCVTAGTLFTCDRILPLLSAPAPPEQ